MQTMNGKPMTPDERAQLDPVVKIVLGEFLDWAERFPDTHDGLLPDFEDIEEYVFCNVNESQAAEVVTRNTDAAHGLYVWVRDNGLGAWSELREANPSGYGPGAMFQSVTASWFHDVIGGPGRRDEA
jgi:hypothetical protein